MKATCTAVDLRNPEHDGDDLDGLSRKERAELRKQLYCLHSAIPWRALRPRNGKLHATCGDCKATVTRRAFTN